MRSWRSTAGPLARHRAASVDALGADDVAPRRARRGRSGSRRAPRSRRGPPWRAPPHGVVVDVDPRQRVAERPGVSSAHHSRRRRASRGGIAGADVGCRRRRQPRSTSCGPRLVGLHPVLLREHPQEAVPVHLDEHERCRRSAGEGGDDHAPGAGVEIAQHRPDFSAAFTGRSLARHRRHRTRSVCFIRAVGESEADRTGVGGAIMGDRDADRPHTMLCHRAAGALPPRRRVTGRGDAGGAGADRHRSIRGSMRSASSPHDEAIVSAPASEARWGAANRWVRSTACRRRSRT